MQWEFISQWDFTQLKNQICFYYPLKEKNGLGLKELMHRKKTCDKQTITYNQAHNSMSCPSVNWLPPTLLSVPQHLPILQFKGELHQFFTSKSVYGSLTVLLHTSKKMNNGVSKGAAWSLIGCLKVCHLSQWSGLKKRKKKKRKVGVQRLRERKWRAH